MLLFQSHLPVTKLLNFNVKIIGKKVHWERVRFDGNDVSNSLNNMSKHDFICNI